MYLVFPLLVAAFARFGVMRTVAAVLVVTLAYRTWVFTTKDVGRLEVGYIYAYALPGRLFEFDAAASGPIRQNVDLGAFAAEIGVVLKPLSVQELSVDAGLAQDWAPPLLDVSKHLGYAFQWFALSALITGLYVWFQLVHPRLRKG